MMRNEKATVVHNEPVSQGHYRMGLRTRADFSRAVPGQFVMVRTADRLDPLLRRPFSIHRLMTESGRTVGFEVLYRVVGKGTGLLAACKAGDRLEVLGPLGHGFEVPVDIRHPFIVAGGIGVAPLVFLAETIAARLADPADGTVFLGARCDSDLLCRREFLSLGLKLHLTTDDGSSGDQCLVTHPVEQAIVSGPPDVVYACGPAAMLACLIGIVKHHAIPCQVSLETVMACGMGACLGCAVPESGARRRYRHACTDGPVFEVDSINLP